MRVGVHLPQFGRAIQPGGIQRFATRAEQLGYDDVWVSDHLVVPATQSYPAPYICDPLQALAFAGACTSQIGLGTSVLVVPQYTSPLALANSLASLDAMAGGRVILGAGIGWSAPEYQALGAEFSRRGERLEEMVALLRTAWADDPATFEGNFYRFKDVRLLPKPAHTIPVWIGGTSEAALERSIRIGDGYHGIDPPLEDLAPITKRLRSERPEPTFTISMRISLGKGDPPGQAVDRVRAYFDHDVDHVVIVPFGGDLDQWLANIEDLAEGLPLGSDREEAR